MVKQLVETTNNILSPVYWKEARNNLTNTRLLALSAIFLAMQCIMEGFFIPVGDNLRIYFSFLLVSLMAMICGPVIALCYGFVQDLIGYMLVPSGGFFFGYILSSMAGAFIFALFFYRQRLSVVRIFLAKLLINVFVNIFMGSLWSAMLFGKGYYYYLVKSMIKNLMLLPVEVLLLISVFQLILPIASQIPFLKLKPIKRIPLR